MSKKQKLLSACRSLCLPVLPAAAGQACASFFKQQGERLLPLVFAPAVPVEFAQLPWNREKKRKAASELILIGLHSGI